MPECSCPATDGVIRHERATCADPAVAGLDWYADDLPGTIGDIIAASVEHQSRYRNELRHIPMDTCRHGWPGSDCGSAHPYIAEPTDL